MTEPERIVREGIVRSDFLEPEVRCDYYVSEKQKKIWAVEIDLLLKFDRVCKKHGLHYFLCAGSLLGAIRHGGYVPWDDDLDVAMLRDDYDALSRIRDEFSDPYFLQTPLCESGYCQSIVKLRNSRTCSFSPYYGYCGANQGIMLDIFPIDNSRKETAEKRYRRSNELNVLNSLYMKRASPFKSDFDIKRLKEAGTIDPVANIKELNEIACQYQFDDCDYKSCSVNTVYSYEKWLVRREAYESIMLKPFEGLMVPVPRGYDAILRQMYGDYMCFPPVEKRGAWHAKDIWDPDRPYTEYLKGERS